MHRYGARMADAEPIDWSTLEHNYGPATDIPDLLERCASPVAAVAEEACADLDNALFHQGGWVCSAAAVAVPAIVDLALRESNHVRADLVFLVGELASTAISVDATYVDDRWPAAAASTETGIRQLLDDPDDRLRHEAINLAACMLPLERAERLLTAMLESGPDSATLIDIGAALATLSRRDTAWSRPKVLLASLAESDDPQVRLAALLDIDITTDSDAERLVNATLAALGDDSLHVWGRTTSGCSGPGPLVHNAAGKLLDWPSQSLDLLSSAAVRTGALRDADDDVLLAVLSEAGSLLSRWRTVGAGVAALAATHLRSGNPAVRFRCCYLFACAGDVAAPHADAVASLLTDTATSPGPHSPGAVASAAVWALSRMGDARCLPPIIEDLGRRAAHFGGITSVAGSGPFMFWEIGIGQVLAPLRGQAWTLVPHLERALPQAAKDYRALRIAEVLDEWGLAGNAPKEVVDQLKDVTAWKQAAMTIGLLGSVVPSQRRRAARLLTRRSPDDPALASWVHRRVTGRDLDAHSTLTHILDAANSHPGRSTYLGQDFGRYTASRPAATEDDLKRIRDLVASDDPWTRVRSAEGLWHLTRSDDAVAVFIDVAEGYETHPQPAVAALEWATTAGPTIAVRFRKAAGSLIDRDQRLGTTAGWTAIHLDERACAAARRVLADASD